MMNFGGHRSVGWFGRVRRSTRETRLSAVPFQVRISSSSRGSDRHENISTRRGSIVRKAVGRAFILFVCGLISPSFVIPAAAQRQGHIRACESADANVRISACSRLIERGSSRVSVQQRSSAYNNRATAYLEKKDYPRALDDLNEAIRLDPNNVNAYFNRSLIYLHEGDVGREMDDLDMAIRVDPKHARSYGNRGWQLFVRREYDRALADFSEAIRLNPSDKFSLNNRGLVLMEKGALALAMSDFEAAIRIDPNFSWPHGNRAKIEAKLRSRPPDAAGTPAQTIAALPSHPETAAALAPRGRRVALVIGNSAYQRVPALPNPRGDAELVATALRAVGFQSVRLESDLAREKLIDVLRAFGRETESADWAVVYFAGHGIEVGGVNYLIPVDARLETDRDLQYEAVALEQVLGSVEAARKLRLVILDACRDNPFARQMRRTVASRSIGRGLGRVEPEGGTLVAYAAKHGEIALDGEGTNSPFVASLVQRLPTPGIEINKLFRLVRDDVMAATARKQEPFVYGSLPGEDFFFVAAQ